MIQFNMKDGYFADLIIDEAGNKRTSGKNWVHVKTQEEINAISEAITNGGTVWLERGNICTSGKAPSPAHVFKDGVWTLDEQKQEALMAQAVDNQWEEIKTLRADKAFEGVYIASVDKTFASDTVSRLQYLTLLQLEDETIEQIQWKTVDNSYVPLNRSLLLEINRALIERDNANHLASQAHLNALKQAEKPLEYDFSTGWSAIYGE